MVCYEANYSVQNWSLTILSRKKWEVVKNYPTLGEEPENQTPPAIHHKQKVAVAEAEGINTQHCKPPGYLR